MEIILYQSGAGYKQIKTGIIQRQAQEQICFYTHGNSTDGNKNAAE